MAELARPDGALVGALRSRAIPWQGKDALDALVDLVGDARVVLLGESTHGTHEFYDARFHLTRRLVTEKGFKAVAIEGDWPDAYRVHRYANALTPPSRAEEALAGFQRFPSWMWRNRDVIHLAAWLRAHNEGEPPESRVGFYGLDLYSLHASIEEVLRYLDSVAPSAAEGARERYACFETFGPEPQEYGRATTFGISEDCEQEVVRQLLELRAHREALLRRDGVLAADEFFHAEQNARVVQSAEQYYRVMFHGHVRSWNLRDTHMADTVDRLLEHLGGHVPAPRIVVWAHNSHVGDARGTELGSEGEVTLGELLRKRHPGRTCLIGFTTHRGTVTAASRWGGTPERKRVRPGLRGGIEDLLHRTEIAKLVLPLHDRDVADALGSRRLMRAIGVVYRPETERQSHYFEVELPRTFDALVHFDETRAVEPLDRTAGWERGEAPETFPTGL